MQLRLALRALGRSPIFAVVAIVSLGIALALNTTMFALVDATLHPPVPYPAPEQLYTLSWRGDDPRKHVHADDKARAVREGLTVAQAIATGSGRQAQVVAGGESDDQLVGVVSPEFFDVAGVAPLHGRVLRASDGDAPVAVIDFGLWRRAYGERSLEEGLTIEIDDAIYTIVGVMPPGMHLGSGGGVWIPRAAMSADTTRLGRYGMVHVRLKPGATRAMLERELAIVAQRLQATHGSPGYPLLARLWEVSDEEPRLDDFLKFLLATVGGVLAIACANLATLLLARGAERRREMAVRLAMGASRLTIARHVMAECAIIGTGGAALGLLLTRWAMDLVAHWAPPYVPQLGEFVPDPSWRVFAFALGTAVGVMLLAGLLPALRAASVPPAEPLKDGAGTTRRRRERYSGMVIAEVALSTALLMIAALLVMGNWRLAKHEFGFDARRLIAAKVNLPRARMRAMTGAGTERMHEEILTRLATVPGVRSAATVSNGSPDGPIVLAENGPAGERWINLRSYSIVSPSYLRTLRVPLVQGRDFSAGDRGGTGAVVIVDQEAARRLWPEYASPVGRMIKLGDRESNAPWLPVVGVTPGLARRPDASPYVPDDPDIYVVHARDSTRERSIVVAAERDAADMPLAIRRELRRTVGPSGWISVRRWVAGFEGKVRFLGFLALVFCALSAFALVLCAVGLYGVLAYAVSQRRREFAIRIALGARGPTVARLVVTDAAVMALAGVGIGAFIALAATYGMAADLQNLRFAHARALVAAEVVLLLVAAAAATGPVRRGVRADPATTMQAS